MSVEIKAIGTAVPAIQRHQESMPDFMADLLDLPHSMRKRLHTLYKATQIEYRHSVIDDYVKKRGEFSFFPNQSGAPFLTTGERMKLYQQHALPLVLEAITDCFDQLESLDISEITHLITVSCTGMYAPGLDIDLIDRLHLRTTTKRIAIQFMGCYAVFNAIDIAHSICLADRSAKVLVVSVELCSLHFQPKTDMDNLIANAIFADGAAAILIDSSTETQKSLILNGFYNDLIPQSHQEMAWRVADFGFDIVLSHYVPHLIKSGITDFCQTLLNQYGFDSSQIDFYAIHPGGAKILSACEEALQLSKEDNRYAYQVLRHFGNMSSATILFVLKALFADLSAEDHNKIIMSFAFGPGLTVQSMLLRVKYV